MKQVLPDRGELGHSTNGGEKVRIVGSVLGEGGEGEKGGRGKGEDKESATVEMWPQRRGLATHLATFCSSLISSRPIEIQSVNWKWERRYPWQPTLAPLHHIMH